MGGTGQAPNRQKMGEQAQSTKNGGTGQAPSRQKSLPAALRARKSEQDVRY
ncbi:MAG: hypothetical protein RBU37_10435 [Myxococcota bacterium]|nr:hypothetical protein [Myxococcota bacterium]